MPDWLWVLFIFLALTFGYFIGFTTGSYKNDADKPPTENAYIRQAEIEAETYKEIELRKAELDYQMRHDILNAEREKQNITNQQHNQKEEPDGNML